MHNLQREWYALLTLFFFFLERDVIMDTLFIMIELIFTLTQ
jgi:hypothetical protein